MKVPYTGFFCGTEIVQSCKLVHVGVKATVVDLVCEVTITQEYANRSPDAVLDASYVFPMHPGAAVCSFEARIGERVVIGEVKGKKQARSEYQAAVAAGDGAYMLEQEAEDVFQLKVGNLPPQSKVAIVIGYVMDLKFSRALGAELVIPTTIAPRYGDSALLFYNPLKYSAATVGARAVQEVSAAPYPLDLEIEWLCPPGSTSVQMVSVSHPEELKREPGKMLLHAPAALDKDFVLNVTYTDPSTEHYRGMLERHGKSHVAMITLVPLPSPNELAAQPHAETEFVFVLDRSGSMQGEKMKSLKKAMVVFLRSLPVKCLFNIIGFGSDCVPLWPQARAYDADSLADADRYVDKMEADMGGTELAKPFEKVLQKPLGSHVRTQKVFLLTDGQVNNPEEIFALISQHAQQSRVFALGIGDDVSHALINGVARAGRGTAEFVMATVTDNIAGKVMLQLKNAMQNCVDGIHLEWTPALPKEKPDHADMVHKGISCDGCRTNPIYGQRFKCRFCADYDLCAGCLSKLVVVHDTHKHDFRSFDSVQGTHNPLKVTGTTAPKEDVTSLVQTPAIIPPAFEGCRSTIYAFFPEGYVPTSVRVSGTRSVGGEHFDVTIPLDNGTIPEGLLIHRCAARRLIRDLDDKNTRNSAADPLIRVSTKYNILCSQTAFIAIEKRSGEERAKILSMSGEKETKREGYFGGRGGGGGGGGSGGAWALAAACMTTQPNLFGGPMTGSQTGMQTLAFAPMPMSQPLFGGGVPSPFGLFAQQSQSITRDREGERDRDSDTRRERDEADRQAFNRAQVASLANNAVEVKLQSEVFMMDTDDNEDNEDEDDPKVHVYSSREIFDSLAKKQEFDGNFNVTLQDIALLFGISVDSLASPEVRFYPKPWRNAVVIVIFEQLLADLKDEWDLLIAKARRAMPPDSEQIIAAAELVVKLAVPSQ